MTTAKKGINAAGLDQIFSSKGAFSLFLLTDMAFRMLSGKTVTEKIVIPP